MPLSSWPLPSGTVYDPAIHADLRATPEGRGIEAWIFALSNDGSRTVVNLKQAGSPSNLLSRNVSHLMRKADVEPDSPVLFWNGNLAWYFHWLNRETFPQYVNYGLGDDCQFSEEPVNQIPHLFDPRWGALMAHACTFAHHISANYNPHSYMLGDEEHFDMLPLTPHTSESNQRNRIVLRYARTLVGLVYDRVEFWERLPAVTSAEYVGTSLDWRHRMTRLRELDGYICSVCGENEFWPREMLFKLGEAADWITAFDRYEQPEGSVNYTVGLPKIVKGATWTPSQELVADSSVNLGSLRGHQFWKGAVRDFRRAVMRWDTDPQVRFDPSAH